jgi:hypothetical protein
MNELQFAHKVRQHLNRGLYALSPETTSRLATARQNALAHQKQMVSQSVLASAGSFVQFHLENLRLKQLLVSLALLLSIVSAAFWTADYRIAELTAIDSALLADELPIGAFTDKGFAAWLKSASSE